MNTLWKNLLLITLGAFLLAFSVVVFFAPNQIVTGGPPGIGIILFYLFKIPLGITVFLVNLLLMLVGARLYGRGYFFRTLYAVIAASVFIEALVLLLPNPAWTDEPILNVVYGSVLLGTGFALCFKGEAASGGLSTAAQIIAQRLNMGVGRVIQFIDGGIVIVSGILFRNIESALWAGIGVFIAGFIVDLVMRKSRMEKPTNT